MIDGCPYVAEETESSTVLEMALPVWTAPDKCFTKTVIKEGISFPRPNEGSKCSVYIDVSSEDMKHQKLYGYPINQETEIVLGDGKGELSFIIDGTLETMRTGEHCRIDISPDIVEDIKMKCKRSDPEEESLSIAHPLFSSSFDIHLRKFERSPDIHKLSLKQVVERMRNYKTFGSECFKDEKTELAERFYVRALKYAIAFNQFINEKDEFPEVVEKFWDINNLCLLNLAACQLRSGRYADVITNCTKAMAIDDINPKGYFRRGQAHMAHQDYELAHEDFKKGLQLQPNNKALQEQLKIVQGKIKQLEQGYAKSMKKLFE